MQKWNFTVFLCQNSDQRPAEIFLSTKATPKVGASPSILGPGMCSRWVLVCGAMHPFLCWLENLRAWMGKGLSVLTAWLLGMLRCSVPEG